MRQGQITIGETYEVKHHGDVINVRVTAKHYDPKSGIREIHATDTMNGDAYFFHDARVFVKQVP